MFPHQQYGYGLKSTKVHPNFGNKYPGRYHVGEDTGWMLQGLPIHSIGNCRVTMIHHDMSWGTMVVTECLVKGDTLTVSYAHLSLDLDVEPGQTLKMGDKIGEIGPSVPPQNGGYWAHIHMGIEKSNSNNARLKGYSSDISRWHAPISFIESLRKKLE